LDSPRIALIRRLFDLMETDNLAVAAEELIANSVEDVVFEPHAAHGEVIRGHEDLRRFWADFAQGGVQMRAGAYSIAEEGDSVVVTGWVRTIDEGRLADTQSRWVYRFDDQNRVVSARAERA
jgi:ketosteroid isomerase-like protein